jgi:hypothetical protein
LVFYQKSDRFSNIIKPGVKIIQASKGKAPVGSGQGAGLGWAYLVVELDWFSRKPVGWQWSGSWRSQEGREAREEVVLAEFAKWGEGLKLIAAKGQPARLRIFPGINPHPGN